MTVQELTKKIMEENKGRVFITPRKLSKIIGIGRERTNEILSDLSPAYGAYGKPRRQGAENMPRYYFVEDVAKEIMRKGI